MAYLIQIGLALFAQVLWEAKLIDATPRVWLVIALCLVPHALGALAQRLYMRGRFQAADRAFLLLSWSPLILHALSVFNGGWLVLLEGWTDQPMRLVGLPSLWIVLSFAPFVVFSLLSIDARSRLGGGSRERSRKLRRAQWKLFAASLAPILAFVLISSGLGAIAAVRMQIETVAVWNTAYAAVLLVAFIASVPWLLRNSWDTEPMPASVERSLLESVAQLANFDGRRLFIWRTGNSVANAAILGLFPRQRVVLFSDRLLSQLDLRELAGVFGHEIGHAKKNHVVIFAAWAFAALFGADELASWLAPDGFGWNAAVMLGAMALWAFGFGWMSRRFELEADLYSLRLIKDPAPLIGALEKISGPHGRAKTSWRHFSTARRIEFLEAVTRDPAVGQRLERRLSWVARSGIVLFLAVIGVAAFGLAKQWPADQVMLDLRRGAYASAAQRIEHHPVQDADLTALVHRAVGLRQGDLPEIERLAREALSKGDIEAFAQWIDLGALRGNAHMAVVGDLLSALKSEPPPGADEVAERLSQVPAAWRDALEPLLRAMAR